jgi:cytochrome c oxidase cbb3-type subunit III
MPPMLQVIGGEQAVADAAQYVLSLSGRKHDAEMAQRGQKIFNTVCFACHGPDAKGNPVIGSANLTDNIWLFGGTEEDIRTTIRGGRISQMPAHKKLLGEEKVHLLALYVYSLSHSE